MGSYVGNVVVVAGIEPREAKKKMHCIKMNKMKISPVCERIRLRIDDLKIKIGTGILLLMEPNF